MVDRVALNGKTVLIAGATASGKSTLALALAERVGGVVINADSRQVYREMRVLTARPTAGEEARAPHRLYGHVAAADAYSAARYVADATREIAAAHAAAEVPIVVGGTGLYFKALLEGLSPVPPIPDEVRRRWREAGARAVPGELHRLLAERDPEIARRLVATDIQRIVRALEVHEATGRSLNDWQRVPGRPVVREEETVRLVVRRERAELHARCNLRFETMIGEGALDEARTMAALKLDPGLPAMRAIGLRPLMAHLAGEIDLATAVQHGQAETRQYVKRQESWIKRYFVAWNYCKTKQKDDICDEILPFIQF